MKRMIVLGSTGQVGWELRRSLAPLGEVIALERTNAAPTLPDGRPACGDLLRLEDLAATVCALRPDVVVNAAAYTAVDNAETERVVARTANAEAPAALAVACASIGALLVHYSTDYVFDGSGDAPWREEDPSEPLNVYGETKRDGERAIRASGCRHLIFRTSWVYAARGGNFLRTMLRLARERDALSVVDDQFGAPTGAELLADVTAHVLRRSAGRNEPIGTYHVTAGGSTTWYAYALAVIEQARSTGWPVKVEAQRVAPISASAYPLPARRPRNSRLDCARFTAAFDLRLPSWEEGVRRAVAELTTN